MLRIGIEDQLLDRGMRDQLLGELNDAGAPDSPIDFERNDSRFEATVAPAQQLRHGKRVHDHRVSARRVPMPASATAPRRRATAS